MHVGLSVTLHNDSCLHSLNSKSSAAPTVMESALDPFFSTVLLIESLSKVLAITQLVCTAIFNKTEAHLF